MPKGARGRHRIMHRATKRRYPSDAKHVEVVGVCASDQVVKQG